MEDYYEYLDSNGVTTLYKLIKDDTVALIDSYSVTINGITTTLDTHINNSDIHTPISDIENMVDTKIAGLVNSAPETLDTLKELSDALGNDPNFATTVANQIGSKASKDDVYTKEETDTLLEGKANSVHNHVVKDITDFPTIPTKTSQLINDSGFLTSFSGVITSVSWSDITDKPNFSTVATSGSYNDLSNKPTIPKVYNKTLTIQKNGTNVATFTSNSNIDVTADITVPTKVSELSNDSGFITGISWDKVTNKPTLATVATSGSYTDLSNTPTIPTKVSQLENDMGFGTGGDTSDCVHKTGDETIDGTKTFANKLISNKELHYTDTKYDWTDTSLNTWCNAGNVAWFDKTGNRRMHELVGANGGVWRKVCYINENEYFSVDSNRNITFRGGTTFNGNLTASKFIGNLQGNADSATKASYLDSYSQPGVNKIYLDWDGQVKSYVGLKVDIVDMGGLITTKNIGSILSSVNSARYATTQATTDNSNKIATTAWVRNYVDSVESSSEVGSSIAAYYSNATTLIAEGNSSSSGGSYPSDYSDYINISPTVGTIYTGSQLFGTLNASASGSKNSYTTSESTNYQTTAKAAATFSGAFSSSAKYLCTTANAVRFRAYVSAGTTSDIGTASVVDNSSTKSIFTRIE